MSTNLKCFNCNKTFKESETKQKEVNVPNFSTNGVVVGKRKLPACPHCGAVAIVGFNEA